MTKSNISQYDATASNNTDIDGTDIAENCSPAGINNAIRSLMSHLKQMDVGTVALTSPKVTGDLTISDKIVHSGDTNTAIRFADADTVTIETGASEAFRIDSSQNVGIGTTPASGVRLDMRSDAAANIADLRNANSAGFGLYVAGGTGSSYYALRAADKDNAALFTVLGNGNTLVGKTTNAIGTAGVTLQADGFFSATRSGNQCAGFNRLSDDGNIVEFRKDGTLAGAIGSTNTIGVRNIFVAGTGNGLSFGNVTTYPVDENGTKADNSRDLGFSSGRFDDIFATNSTINTSDQNEKQDIASLTSAEITAAKAISKLFKTYKWKDKVASKGDSARTHTGVIAQEVQSAMTDAGLDATKYAFWCSDTWWEKDVEVAAVEAVDAVTETHTDQDGNKVEMVIEEAVEARDAYTRTDFYDTADAAPEGATERTRLGIRYPELLAFIGAATEQRLTDIETRLAALEG